MTDPEHDGTALDDEFHAQSHAGGHRKAKATGGRARGCLPVLIVLAIVLALLYVGLTRGIDFVQDQFGDPEDYPGPGSGSVTVEVVSGDTIGDMGRTLEEAGCGGFRRRVHRRGLRQTPCAPTIQAGFYPLKKKMKAADALAVMCDPANIDNRDVTIPEGLRVDQVVDVLVEATGLKKSAFEKVLDDPSKLGLPAYAQGNPEGYLFPDTYRFTPEDKPVDMLREMVAQFVAGGRRAADLGRGRRRPDRARPGHCGEHRREGGLAGRGPARGRRGGPQPARRLVRRPGCAGRPPADGLDDPLPQRRWHRQRVHRRRGARLRLALQHLPRSPVSRPARSRRRDGPRWRRC